MAANPSSLWIAYADGSCLGNPGRGGWGVLLIDPDGTTRELAGADPSTTNNRMEITAAIEALRNLAPGAPIKLYSDSQYVIKTMTLGWKRRENLDLWKILDEETQRHRVQWEWVRGHSGDPRNERADELARSAAEGRAPRANRGVAPTDAQGDIASRIAPLLRSGEEVRPCAHCGRDFVAAGPDRCCSLVECQLQARSAR
jgi:ribonuclease HI